MIDRNMDPKEPKVPNNPPQPQVLFTGTNGDNDLVGNRIANQMYGYDGNDTLSG